MLVVCRLAKSVCSLKLLVCIRECCCRACCISTAGGTADAGVAGCSEGASNVHNSATALLAPCSSCCSSLHCNKSSFTHNTTLHAIMTEVILSCGSWCDRKWNLPHLKACARFSAASIHAPLSFTACCSPVAACNNIAHQKSHCNSSDKGCSQYCCFA